MYAVLVDKCVLTVRKHSKNSFKSSSQSIDEATTLNLTLKELQV